MNYDWILDEAMRELLIGNKDEARKLLRGYIVDNPGNERGWLYYAKIAPNIDQRLFCLKKVLEINPGNSIAQKQLDLENQPNKSSLTYLIKMKNKRGLRFYDIVHLFLYLFS